MLYNSPKGTQDILPVDVQRWQWLENEFRKSCALYGYGEIRTPIFEATDLFTRGVGEETDIVSKQMYSFQSRGGDALTLRPEGTAPVVRALLQHNLYSQSGVQKIYYIGPIFRYERPQKGRYRQFHQIGVEAFGSPGPDIDAEMLAFAADFLQEIGITQVTLELNSVGCPDCRPRYREALRESLAGIRDELCPDCARRYESNPLRILDCKVEHCRELTREAPVMLDVLCAECKEHLSGVEAGLRSYNIAYTLNPRIVRGLDYYTRTAFEFITVSGLGSQNTVLAGGRYDGLAHELGGPMIPAIGFAAGEERLLLSLAESLAMPSAPGPVFFALLGAPAREFGLPMAQALRRAGIPAASDYAARSLKAQMKEADRQHAALVVILGDNELATGQATVRRMSDSQQESIALPGLLAYLKEH